MKAQIQIPVAGQYDGICALSDAQIALSAWIISEGSFIHHPNRESYAVRIHQKRSDNVESIVEVLDETGYKYSRTKRSDGMTVFYLNTNGFQKIKQFVSEKNVPDWAFALNNKQFDLFFDTLIRGDGHAISRMAGQYYSKSENLIDRLQWAAIIHGYRTKKHFKEGGFKNGGWVLNYCKRNTTDFVLSKGLISPFKYQGKIWCVRTRGGSFIARRSGMPFITGNCMGHDHQKSIALVSRLYVSGGHGELKVRNRKILLARTGSFLKGYEDGKASYIVDKAMKPSDLGTIKIELTPRRTNPPEERFYVDLHASI